MDIEERERERERERETRKAERSSGGVEMICSD
jgi:hypothetical protein